MPHLMVLRRAICPLLLPNMCGTAVHLLFLDHLYLFAVCVDLECFLKDDFECFL